MTTFQYRFVVACCIVGIIICFIAIGYALTYGHIGVAVARLFRM